MREWGEVNRTRKPKTGPFCSQACANRYRCTGKPLAEEHKKKMQGRTPWNKGREHSAETKAKIAKKARLRTGENNPNWKGGRYLRPDGYYEIRIGGRYKMEHVHVMEQHLGRRLTRSEVVHHKNGDKTDNRLENLEVMTVSEHMRHHHKTGIERKVTARTCVICGMTFQGKHPQNTCGPDCKRQRQREYGQKHDAKRRGNTAKRADE